MSYRSNNYTEKDLKGKPKPINKLEKGNHGNEGDFIKPPEPTSELDERAINIYINKIFFFDNLPSHIKQMHDHYNDKEEFESPSNPTDEILGMQGWKSMPI